MQRKFLPAVAFFVLLLVLFAHFGARMAYAEPVFSFAAQKEIYLTFDDGPSTRVTGSILDTLAREHTPATFFVVGDRIGGREEILRRTVREGHTVGVHSNTHRYGEIYASDEAFVRDVMACAKRIEETAGVTPTVYRFPGGGAHPEKRVLLERMGYRVVAWNAVCGDEEIAGATAELLAETSFSTARGKERVVLLLHDSAPHTATAEALPAIIDGFRQAGYVFRAF